MGFVERLPFLGVDDALHLCQLLLTEAFFRQSLKELGAGCRIARKRPANPSCRFPQAQTAGCQRCGSNSPILL